MICRVTDGSGPERTSVSRSWFSDGRKGMESPEGGISAVLHACFMEDVAGLLLDCEYDARPLPVHVRQHYLQRPGSRNYEIVVTCGKFPVDLTVSLVRKMDFRVGQVDVRRFEGFLRRQFFLDELEPCVACLAGKSTPKLSSKGVPHELYLKKRPCEREIHAEVGGTPAGGTTRC